MIRHLEKDALHEQFVLRKISTLAHDLVEWRSENERRQANIKDGDVFDFVKGLRLAARLIYILKEKLR